ncbi:MAG: SDR family oxidoreductase [Pseudomonadales bacterium]
MHPEQILIAGNMGYVGPAVVRSLRNAFPQARLSGLDLGLFAHCLTGADSLPERLLDVQMFGDLRHTRPESLQGLDVVVNLAAISNDPMGKAFAEATDAVNCRAAIRLARLAKDAGAKRYVFASSCSVYGQADGAPRRESDPLNPLTAYARSKIDAEIALQELADDDFIVTCLRFPTACGMSPRLRLDLVLNDFVASAVASGRIDILSDGTPWRPLIDTNDMALAIEWASERTADRGGAFLAVNVGTPTCNYQVKELAAAVAEQIPGTDVAVNPDAAPDKRSYQVDFSLYGDLAPDHLPRIDLGESIRQLHAGLKRMAFAERNFRESQFVRLKVLAQLREQGRLNDRIEWVTDAAAIQAAVA